MSRTVCQEIIADMGFALPTTPRWSWLLPGHPALPGAPAPAPAPAGTASATGMGGPELPKNPLALPALWADPQSPLGDAGEADVLMRKP